MRIGVKPGQWGWTFEELSASWQAAEEAGFEHVSCFDWLTAAPRGYAVWDAPTLLAAMAGYTSRITLTVAVLNTSLRHPYLLAAQLAVVQAASGGRLRVGLGAGADYRAEYDNAALGLPFPDLACRRASLEGCCRAFPALWRGEEVTDEQLGLRAASLGPLAIEPPAIVVGGRSEALLEVAARYADGWDTVESEPSSFAALVERLDQTCRRVGRRRPIERSVQVFAEDEQPAALRTKLRDLADAGATSATVILHRERGPDAVRRLAQAML